jgi:FkbM family methyltransferase
MGYSQHNEDGIILGYLQQTNKEYNGIILDVGANDGVKYSNSRMFIEQYGWKGVLIEPTKDCVAKLNELYQDNKDIEIFDVAIDEQEGEKEIHIGTLIGEGINQISTLNQEDKKYWESNRGVKYDSEIIKTTTIKKVLEQSAYKTFDIVSIDAEGSDLLVLSQILFENIYPTFIIFEYNDNNDLLYNMKQITSDKYDIVFQNTINVILKLR